jgi:hypothetical protein
LVNAILARSTAILTQFVTSDCPHVVVYVQFNEEWTIIVS